MAWWRQFVMGSLPLCLPKCFISDQAWVHVHGFVLKAILNVAFGFMWPACSCCVRACKVCVLTGKKGVNSGVGRKIGSELEQDNLNCCQAGRAARGANVKHFNSFHRRKISSRRYFTEAEHWANMNAFSAWLVFQEQSFFLKFFFWPSRGPIHVLRICRQLYNTSSISISITFRNLLHFISFNIHNVNHSEWPSIPFQFWQMCSLCVNFPDASQLCHGLHLDSKN